MLRAAFPLAALALLASLGVDRGSSPEPHPRGRPDLQRVRRHRPHRRLAEEHVCTFNPRRGRNERYVGVIRRFGLDIGATRRGRAGLGGLLRRQRGAAARSPAAMWARAAEATVGAGLGANVLVGGSNRSIALQPVSVSGQTGLNFALGVGDLELRPAR